MQTHQSVGSLDGAMWFGELQSADCRGRCQTEQVRHKFPAGTVSAVTWIRGGIQLKACFFKK